MLNNSPPQNMLHPINPHKSEKMRIFFVPLPHIKGYFYGYKEFCCRRF